MRTWAQKRFPKISAFLIKHRERLPLAALATGLVWDSLTLGRPDRLFDNVVLLFYVVLAGLCILLTAWRAQQKRKIPLSLRLIVQFSFGNLTSALFILYSISGTLAGNWVFFVMLIALLLGNELLGPRYGELRFNLSVYYLLVLAYFVLITPVLFSQIGTHIFLIAGVLSIGVAVFYAVLLERIAPLVLASSVHFVSTAVLAIFVTFNVLYFTHLIPPVPLALRDMGIYHQVERTNDEYTLSYVPGEWYEFFRDSDDTIYMENADARAYCFSSVFAPADIQTPIVHHWEYYNASEEQWETHATIPFSITGGREAGYRGQTFIGALRTGTWRCNVETEGGALIGRQSFEVKKTDEMPDTQTVVR